MYLFNIFFTSTVFFYAYGRYQELILSSLWEAEPEECGKTKYDKEPIEMTKDNKAAIGQFPWTARIGAIDPDTNSKFFFCGGSLISRYFVITAAHCGIRGKFVRLGENIVMSDIDCDECGECAPPPQDINITDFLPSDHCRLSNHNDIMVVKLENEAQFNEFVQPICLPNDAFHNNSDLNQPLIISGFGTVYSGFGKPYSRDFPSENDLMYNNVSLLNNDKCNGLYQWDLKEGLCIGKPSQVDHYCVADSGTPLTKWVEIDGVKRAFLVGIASHNLSMCKVDYNFPVVYTNFGLFHKWLAARIKKSMNMNESKIK